MGDAILFEDAFECTGVDQAKYDRVARITASSASKEIRLTLDVNRELYAFGRDDNFQLAISSTLNNDGTRDEGKSWREVQRGETTLADHYDYVMYGKVYRFEEVKDKDGIIAVYISFGGLLLQLEGPYKKLTPLRSDNVYLLMRKS